VRTLHTRLIDRLSISHRQESALKGLHNEAQGQRRRRATLGYKFRATMNPEGVPHSALARCNPFRVKGTSGTSLIPGWRFAARLRRLPWATLLNACGVNGKPFAIFFVLALMNCVGKTLPARAEVITIEHDDSSQPTIYVMTVTPSPEPKPALKYHFLVPPVDRIHGNAATLYYKAMSYEGPDPNEPLSKVTCADDQEPSKALFDLPLSKFPQKQAEELVRWLDGGYFEWIRDAGRCDHCDWMDGIRQHGISTLLPQAQASRTTCWSLALRARLQIAQGKIDDAVETLRAGYGWSRNLSHAPTLIQCFIGNVFQELLNPQVCALIGQENSPNLYWALTDLATEPIDFHEALSYESKIWEFSLHSIEDLDRRVLSPEEANKLAKEISDITSRRGDENVATTLLWAVQLEPEARKYLLAHGYTAEKLDAMPVLQVAMLYRWKQYEVVRDDCFKFLLLPDAESQGSAARSDQAVRAAYARGEGTPFTNLLPAIHAASYARLRSMRQINLLRTVEALRMYAAEHGRWPEKLDDIKAVPVPIDPFTEKPFEYSMKDGVALLRPVPDGPGGTYSASSGPQRYELTLKKPSH
jgi:hypothetical protein